MVVVDFHMLFQLLKVFVMSLFLPKQLVDLFVNIMVKTRSPLCARESRKRCEELACPAEDGEQVDERVDELVDVEDDEQVEFQEEEQPEQDLHAAQVMLRRVHANFGHPSEGLMLRLLRDANAPPENSQLPDIFIVSTVIYWLDGQEQSDLYKCLEARNLATPFQLLRVTGNETEMDVKQSS